MYFPTAEIEVFPLYPALFAFGISLFCSLTGISGAFLLLPYQISILGYAQPGVSATNQIFNILACPAGVFRYAREGRLLLPLVFFISLGTLPGVFIGAIIRLEYLANPAHFKIFAAFVLFYLGLRMLFSKNARASKIKGVAGKCKVTAFSWRGFKFLFNNDSYSVAGIPLLLLSFIVGLIGGIYGVGGGAIMVPFLISFFGLPVYAIAGASLCATFITSVAGVLFYSLLSYIWNIPTAAPDWLLGFFLGLGGIFGMYCGAALQKHIPAAALKMILICILLMLGSLYLWQSL